jgi:TATA-box binding protein (TBP) (component of TFIID and TFIIIB)
MKNQYAPPSVSGSTYIYKVGNAEVLVMVFDNGKVHFAIRKSPTDTWSPPIPADKIGRF